MDASGSYLHDQDMTFDYLCVDAFIKDIVSAQALATAFELRLIDYLSENQHSTFDTLKGQLKSDDRGLRLLIDLLLVNNVVEESNCEIKLTGQFTKALQYRDLLETKLEFANISVYDVINHFSLLITSPDEFARKAGTFKLFSYDRCLEYSAENYECTKRWMRITTSLTKYEAHVCMKYHDFSQYGRMLDIGGNSGEFVLQICRKFPKIYATVFDLPLVCDVGQEHILHEAEVDRISFVKGNALEADLPAGFDIITFKSILHDWPEKEAKQFIVGASKSLKSGGTLLIFERGPLEIGETTLPYSTIPFMFFSHAFRLPGIYSEQLKELGFLNVTVQRIELEMPFFLVSAVKGT